MKMVASRRVLGARRRWSLLYVKESEDDVGL